MDRYTGNTVEELAKLAAGNWLTFDSYGRLAEDNEPDSLNENWTIVYTSNRDSNLMDTCNAEIIAENLRTFTGDVRDESAGHWACGHVSGHAIRVYDKTGIITAAFRKYVELEVQIEDYPILDEDMYSDRKFDAAIDLCESEDKVWQELSEQEQEQFLNYAEE